LEEAQSLDIITCLSFEEDKNKAFRTMWKTNWHNDTGQHFRHVDLDFTEEYKKI
jgi:hypothetical protein